VIRYILRRVLLAIPTLFVVSVIIFSLMRIVPGDAALLKVYAGEDLAGNPEAYETTKHQMGLDRPFPVQYADWVWRMVCCGDLGVSYWTKRPVAQEISARLPVTVELAVLAMVVATLIAIPAGLISAVWADRPVDYVARMLATIGLAVPNFWLGTILVVFLGLWFGYSPPLGFVSIFEDPLKNLQQIYLPALTLGAAFAASSMRMTRTQMLEVLRQEYVLTARAKGLAERSVVLRHALRNALIPVITITGLQAAILLGGAVVVESVFTLPGLGTSTVLAINLRDYPQIQANVLFIASLLIVANLIVDVAYAWLDPRIRYS
jgi:peptide/nickel transport system permease protein